MPCRGGMLSQARMPLSLWFGYQGLTIEVEITSMPICADASLGMGSWGTANYREIAGK